MQCTHHYDSGSRKADRVGKFNFKNMRIISNFKQINYLALMVIIFSACEKKSLKDFSETKREVSQSTNRLTSNTTSVDRLLGAINYDALPATHYTISEKNISNAAEVTYSLINFEGISPFTFNTSKAGTIATDGSNYFGINTDGETYFIPFSTGSSVMPTSSSGLTYQNQIFSPEEVEYCSGNMYAINSLNKLFKINSYNSISPSLSVVGDLFSLSFKGSIKKSLYNKFSSNSLHLVTVEVANGTLRLYNIDLVTGLATLVNTFANAIPVNINSDVSSYYSNGNTYIYVQDFNPLLLGYSNYTLYKINSSNVLSTVASSSGYKTGDFACYN